MDFLYRNIHMEQKKWEAATQMTIEEDINVPENKGDCVAILLKDGTISVEEMKSGRDQVVMKGCLQYQILYETGNRLEELCGSIPFEEVLHVDGAAPGDLPVGKGVLEDFKVSMINTRKLAVQSVVMLYAGMQQLSQEEWTNDIVNCGGEVEKLTQERSVLQLNQKKNDVFRIKEEMELPTGYPAIARVLWKHLSLGTVEIRPMDGKISVKGECNCCVMYLAQGASQAVKILQKKVPFHGLVECSGSNSDRLVSVLPTMVQSDMEVKPDSDGEDRVLYVEASLDLQIRVYGKEQTNVLLDLYATNQEIIAQNKEVWGPVIPLVGEGKCKVKGSHRLKDGNAKAVQVLHTFGTVFPDREAWEDNKLSMSGSVQFQILYLTGEEEMPYAVTECMVPYNMEMDGDASQTFEGTEKPILLIVPRIEQTDASLVDSEEMELKGILAFTVLVLGKEKVTCVGSADCKPLDRAKYAKLPSMVVCFGTEDGSLWEYGKRYYMPVEEIKRLNHINGDSLKVGESMLLVKGGSNKGEWNS